MTHAVFTVDFNKPHEIGYLFHCGVEMWGLPPHVNPEVPTRTTQIRYARNFVQCEACIAAITGKLLTGVLRPLMLFEWVPDA